MAARNHGSLCEIQGSAALYKAMISQIDSVKVYRVPSPPDNSSRVGGVYAKAMRKSPSVLGVYDR
jgi:hypothetical protein